MVCGTSGPCHSSGQSFHVNQEGFLAHRLNEHLPRQIPTAHWVTETGRRPLFRAMTRNASSSPPPSTGERSIRPSTFTRAPPNLHETSCQVRARTDRTTPLTASIRARWSAPPSIPEEYGGSASPHEVAAQRKRERPRAINPPPPARCEAPALPRPVRPGTGCSCRRPRRPRLGQRGSSCTCHRDRTPAGRTHRS